MQAPATASNGPLDCGGINFLASRDGRDDRRGEDLIAFGMDVDSDDGRRSPRSRKYSDKGDRRRERDYGGGNRDRGRDRERDRGHDRDRDRDREYEKDRDRGERVRESDRDRERSRKRERERDSRRSRSPRHDHQWADDYDSRKEPRIQGRGRDSSTDREKSHKRGIDRVDDDIMMKEGQRAAIVAEFVDGIVREHDQQHVEAASHSPPAEASPGPPAVAQAEEEEMMKKLGIPVGFTTTKGKYVADANHSAVKLTTKRTPRQYMNRRARGFFIDVESGECNKNLLLYQQPTCQSPQNIRVKSDVINNRRARASFSLNSPAVVALISPLPTGRILYYLTSAAALKYILRKYLQSNASRDKIDDIQFNRLNSNAFSELNPHELQAHRLQYCRVYFKAVTGDSAVKKTSCSTLCVENTR
ncbi:hypothetical protein R1flu_012083 [Riccia fluitans]|uniref:U4/U6.U5 small nuclear ribonucleoprotein 27kDa protein domain-containing protein n=1 Tax=Riccia fluitans TaxID=41844 RepID=A0ABD1Z9M6_9MARC